MSPTRRSSDLSVGDISKMGDVVGFLVGNFIETLNRRSRRAAGWKMEWKGTWGMRWGFPREVQSDQSSAKWTDMWLETRLEWVVGWVYGGSRHEVPDVVLGQEVPDRGATAPHRPDPRSRQEEGAWLDKLSR